jgi:CDGSH-type Zn-finger protein
MSGADVVIVPYKDGPYLVRGAVALRDQTGEIVPLTRQPIALCRCGKSQIRPFCDGTHQTIRFRAPSAPEANPATEAGSASPREGGARPQKGSEPAQAALVRTQQILTAVARDPESGHDPTIGAARPLVVAALQLLQIQSARNTSSESAVLLLIRGALDALEQDSSARFADAVHELRQAAKWLDAPP